MAAAPIDFSQYEEKPKQIDFSKYAGTEKPAEEKPSTYERLTSAYDPAAAEFDEKHPIIGKPVRFLSSLGGTVLGVPGGIYHAIADPPTAEEEKEFQGHTRIPGELAVERMTGGPLVRGVESWIDPKTRPTLKQAASVLPEALGQGAGTYAAAELGGEGSELAVRPLRGAARSLYQSALKPSTTLGVPRVSRMVETGLENQVPVSHSGLEKAGGLIEDTNQAITDTIAKNPTRTVNKFKVASRLSDTAKKFSTQVNPESDLAAITESGNEFLRNQPGEIPAPEAQALKQGTYKQLKSKAYGELKGANIESQKSLARGLKEELAKAYPELDKLNAKDSRLIDLHEALEKAVVRSANREPLGIGGPVAGGMAKIATGSTPIGMAAWAFKEALRNPTVKSKLAIALNATRKAAPDVGAFLPFGGGISELGVGPTNQR